MKRIQVACAIIESKGKVLYQRSESMSLPLKWEFPGGKINDGERPSECLKREILEELGIEVTVGQSLAPATHRYPDSTVTLYPFLCTIIAGKIPPPRTCSDGLATAIRTVYPRLGRG